MLNYLLSFFSNDLAIDLGTASTLVYVRGKGIIINEPSVVAVKKDGKGRKVLAVGKDAKAMLGRTPGNITAIRPLKDGVIADFEVTEEMLKYFIAQVHNRRLLVRPRIVVGVPSGITQVEKRAVRESVYSAGAGEVYLIEEPMAAAIGSGLPITEPEGNMIVDIGGGTSEIAVISLSGIVQAKSIRIGGDKFDEAIVQYIKRKYNLFIGMAVAETIKMTMGLPMPDDEKQTMEIKGSNLVTGIPTTMTIEGGEIKEALTEMVNAVIDAVKQVLESTPPEIAADLVDKGIMLAGGGALLKNLDVVLRDETKLPITIADDPLTCVVKGAGKALDDIGLLREVTIPIN
ncbi:MAG: rod shape-determining protein [Deltaproteobacteria bacterium]|nr:rod shape-determining protein [Deltaproteobacteria bacterium]